MLRARPKHPEGIIVFSDLGSPKVGRRFLGSQILEQRLGVLEIGEFEALGEPVLRKILRQSCSAGQQAVLVVKSVQDGARHNSA